MDSPARERTFTLREESCTTRAPPSATIIVFSADVWKNISTKIIRWLFVKLKRKQEEGNVFLRKNSASRGHDKERVRERETKKERKKTGDARSWRRAPLIAPARRPQRPLKQLERCNKNNHLQSNLPVHPRGSHDATLGSTDLHDLRSPSSPRKPVPGNSLEQGLSRITSCTLCVCVCVCVRACVSSLSSKTKAFALARNVTRVWPRVYVRMCACVCVCVCTRGIRNYEICPSLAA